MLHLMQSLKATGMEEALLYVDDMNPTNAIKLYEKLGFKVMRKSPESPSFFTLIPDNNVIAAHSSKHLISSKKQKERKVFCERHLLL